MFVQYDYTMCQICILYDMVFVKRSDAYISQLRQILLGMKSNFMTMFELQSSPI